MTGRVLVYEHLCTVMNGCVLCVYHVCTKLSNADPNFMCNETDIRLGGGGGGGGGVRGPHRVEICLENHWETLCDNGWDEADTQVVCRQLGFSTIGM